MRDRADSNAHQRIFRLGATQKVVAPSLEADNFLVESIIEDDFQYQTRKKSVEEELPITIFIQEDFAPVSPTDFKK